MIFEEKKITLKDGRTAILKSPRVEDAEQLLNYIRKSCGETDFLTRYPEEWNDVTIEGEARWVKSRRESESSLVIACYVEDEIVGNCQINFNCSIKTSHRANIGIAILKEYWNLGIGSFMFEALIAAAETKRGVRTLELEFIEGNDRGKALYEKYGFQIVCVRPHAFQLKDGRLLNEYFMQKEIRR